VAPEPFGDGVRDLEECSGRVSEESAARTYCPSGRTWTLLVPSAPVGPGCCRLFLFRGEGKEGGREAAGVPSQWEGTGQEEKGKREGRGSLAMGGNGPGRKGRKRESRGSFTMGGNGPGIGESGIAGVPSQWEGTGQEERRKRVVG
jgi:hypothetical protein